MHTVIVPADYLERVSKPRQREGKTQVELSGLPELRRWRWESNTVKIARGNKAENWKVTQRKNTGDSQRVSHESLTEY